MDGNRVLYLASQQGNGQFLLGEAQGNYVVAGLAILALIVIIWLVLGLYDAFAEWWNDNHKG